MIHFILHQTFLAYAHNSQQITNPNLPSLTHSLHLHKTYAFSGAAQTLRYLNAHFKQQKVFVGFLHLTSPSYMFNRLKL